MSAAAPIPEAFGHFQIERPLGRGAMGTVYLARDTRIGRRVALKTINVSQQQFEDASSAAEYFKRMQREAELSGSLLHPNIVTLYEAGYTDGRISYLVMEYVEGETLLDALKRHRPDPLPVDLAVRIAIDILRGLTHAHSRAIIHRDIKPANILLGSDGVARVADFGIARPQESSMTLAGALLGTPSYMAPEQITSQPITPQADIFSAGVILYEMLSGMKPFAAADATAVMHNILRHTPPPLRSINANVPPELDELVTAMLAKSAAERPAAGEAVERLEATAARLPQNAGVTRVTAPQSESSVWQRPISRRTFAAIAGAVLLAVIIPALMIASRIDSSPTALIPAELRREFDLKRQAMEEADGFLAAGQYAEARDRYDAYLQKYPYSIAAMEGRERAQASLDSTQSAETPAVAAKRPRSREENITPSQLLRKLRRALRK